MEKSLRKKSISTALIVLLCLSALLAIFFAPAVEVYHGEEADKSIRFRQVVLGSDFAIGLTYGGELYGWDTEEKTLNALGTSYGTSPKKIKVNFVKGPTYTSNGSDFTIRNDTVTADPTDYIVKIAATHSSAAFITNHNNIYTWGKNTLADAGRGILLRSTEANGAASPVPTIIDYEADGQVRAMVPLSPVIVENSLAAGSTIAGGEEGYGSLLDIVGSDDNYIIKHKRGNGVYYFGWGSNRYMTTRAANEVTEDRDIVTEEFYNFRTSEAAVSDMSIGGGTVLISSNNSIYVRGKNYYIPKKSGDYTYDIGHSYQLSSTKDPELKHIIYLENILDLSTGNNLLQDEGVEFTATAEDAGAFNSLFGLVEGNTYKNKFTWTNELLYISAAHGSQSPVYAVNEAFASGDLTRTNFPFEFYEPMRGEASNLSTVETQSVFYNNSNSSISARAATMSIGNGYGYFIGPGSGSGANNVLYFFGNGYNGQSGTSVNEHYNTIKQVSGFDGSPISVVAGKTAMGTPLFDTLDAANGSFHGGRLSLEFVSGSTSKVRANAAQLSEIADGDVFISGMITSAADGKKKVYVWNKDETFTDLSEKFKVFGIDGTEQKSIAALVPGYNNCLVAIDSQGKVYQISYVNNDFVIALKDRFVDENNNVAENFTVKNDNVIKFASSNGRPSKNDEAQSYDKYATITLEEKTDSVEGLTVSGSVYGKVIATNFTGDAFRILREEDTNLRSRYVVSDKLVGNSAEQVPENGKPKFYFKDDVEKTPILDEIRTHYFDYSMSTDSNGVVSIRITPYESTKGRPIIMEYYIGRFGNLADGKTSVDDSAFKFYDFAAVTTEISIANTVAEFTEFNNRLKGESTNNIAIPVLDPNNLENNRYSIAVTNSQFGLAQLAKYYNVSDEAAFNRYVIEQAYAQDKGFPASAKIAKGNLNRYYENDDNENYNVASYYDDTYRYFAFDSDGDALAFESSGIISQNSADSYFRAQIRDIEFTIPLSDFTFGKELNENTLAHFDNIYGLRLEIRGNSLWVSYKVVQFTATASTGRVIYDNAEIGKANTSRSIDTVEKYRVSMTETYRNETGSNTVIYSLQNMSSEQSEVHATVPLYSQSSMTTSISVPGTDGDYYRAEEGFNVYTYPTVRRVVGEEYRFNLKDNGPFTDSDNIYITYELQNRTGEERAEWYRDYDTFTKQFDPVFTSVSLSDDQFSFVSNVPEKYTAIFTVRRFTDESMGRAIKGPGGVDEVITLVFNIEYTATTLEVSTSGVNGTVINTEKTYSISDFTSAAGAEFSDVISSNVTVATVRVENNRRSITVTPLSSGSVIISFNVKQRQNVVAAHFTLNVESRCVMNETVSLYDSAKIYLSKMKLAIAQQYSGDNAFNAEDYILDTVTDRTYAPNGYYFVTRKNSAEDWQKVLPENWPSFIGNVEVLKAEDKLTDESIEITLGSYKNSSSFDEYMLVAKFVSKDSAASRKFEAGVVVVPQKVFLIDESSGEVLSVKVNVNHGNVVLAEGQLATNVAELGNGGEYMVLNLSGLLSNYAAGSGISPSGYEIQVVRAASSSSFDYFEISRDGSGTQKIAIRPKKNTNESMLVNVSISSSAGNRVISFYVEVDGIIETLDASTYITIWLVTAAVVFLILFIIFMIRLGIYWKKRAEQRKIIRKNQMLIKMRDKVHGKSNTVSKEQLVQTKLKLEDPKYAKMFNDMKKAAAEQSSGISIDDGASDKKSKKKNKGGKKSGKKSLDELKAELAAKKEAFAKMQMGEEVPVTDIPISDIPVEPAFGSFGVMPDEVVSNSPLNDKINSDDNILFDVETLDDNN